MGTDRGPRKRSEGEFRENLNMTVRRDKGQQPEVIGHR